MSEAAGQGAGGSIRPATLADLDALLALEEVFPGDRLLRRDFRHSVRSPTIVTLVGEAPGAVARPGALAGYAILHVRRGSRVGRLASVAVAPEQEGRGVGKRLVGAMESAARERGCDRVRLEVRADNGRAARIYEAAGYARFAVEPGYYDDGTDAWRYEKRL